MEENKYIPGKVEITTTEYRELVENNAKLSIQIDDTRRNYWNEQSRANELEEKVKSLENKVQQLTTFITENPDVHCAYKEYLIKQMSDDEE